VIHAQCKNCGTWAIVTDGTDVHAAVDTAGCTCCPLDHAHGQAAAETGTPCRPLTITAMQPVGD
jgi:hypothetical protein